MRKQKSIWMSLLLLLTYGAAAQSIPAGTHVSVRIGSTISSATAHSGDSWRGTLAKPIVVNGQTVARAGDEVTGKVTSAKQSGRLHAPGQLALRLTSVNGQAVSSTA